MFLALSLGSPFKAYSVNMGNGDISSYLNLGTIWSYAFDNDGLLSVSLD